MNCIDLMSKRSEIAKLQKQSNSDQFGSIWGQNDQNNAKLQTRSNYDELHRFDVKTIETTLNYKRDQITMNLHQFDIKTIKNVEARRKTFKTTQNYKTDQITMNCSDLMSKRSKIAKLLKESNYDQFASIWCQNDQKCWVTSQNIQNNAKLQNWSNYNELHRFDVQTIKTTLNYKRDQITMNCIDLMSKRSKQR